MHLHEVHVLEREARAGERDRSREHWTHEQLLARVERGIRIRANESQWAVAKHLRPLRTHQQHRAGSVRQGGGVAGSHGAISSVEHRLQRGQLLLGRVRAHAVVACHRTVELGRQVHRHDLRRETAVARSLCRALVRAERQLVLILARDVIDLRHFLRALAHALTRRRLGDRRRDRDEILRTDGAENLQPLRRALRTRERDELLRHRA